MSNFVARPMAKLGAGTCYMCECVCVYVCVCTYHNNYVCVRVFVYISICYLCA
jgi:hypothetical protein